ncbi:MAG: hypothetical protein NC078_01255 [Ruminococcus sp.]|nr:hypothetical protein [Ruminococcus sp.]
MRAAKSQSKSRGVVLKTLCQRPSEGELPIDYFTKERFIMCNCGNGSGSCCWIIIILLVLFFCCGSNNNGLCGTSC